MTQEKMMTCVSCGNSYTLTDGERSFYEEKQWNLPKRCAGCRASRRAARTVQAAALANAQAVTYNTVDAMQEAEAAQRSASVAERG